MLFLYRPSILVQWRCYRLPYIGNQAWRKKLVTCRRFLAVETCFMVFVLSLYALCFMMPMSLHLQCGTPWQGKGKRQIKMGKRKVVGWLLQGP